MKLCGKCKKTKEYSEFYKDRTKSLGLSSYCKVCVSINNEFNRNNKKDEIKEYRKKYYIENKDKILRKNKLNRKLSNGQWDKNKWSRLKNNKEKYTKYLENKRNYKKNRLKSDIIFKLKERLRNRTYYALKSKNFNKSIKFNKYIGCTLDVLFNHLENKFYSNINWDNYGSVWVVDHIVPLGSAKTEQELYELCKYTNLQPLLIKDNINKISKDLEYINRIL